MRVAALADGLKHVRLVAPYPDTDITAVTNDSRRVTPGALYAALPGLNVDGHDYIPAAIAAGASAVLCERLPDRPSRGVAWFVADPARPALSEIADRFYGHPSRDILVVGVTGTDGKTSTVYFIHQLLAALTGASSFLSTAAVQIGPQEEPNRLHQSTPEAPEVHAALRAMADRGSRYAVLESTSHGLSRRTSRLAHVSYHAAVFTNLSHEHLEFHGTYEQYRSDKANLFRALDAGCYADADEGVPRRHAGGRQASAGIAAHDFPLASPFGVVNADDPESGYFAASTAAPVLTCSLAAPADYHARDIATDPSGTTFHLVTPLGAAPSRVPVPGMFNVSNVLNATAVVQGLTGCSPGEIAEAIGSLRSAKGRLDVIQRDPFTVIVDYAHTPGSFETVLPFFREQTAGRLIVVFGSAGDRDVEKRPLQGRIASRYADLIVLADEDPRSEDPMEILREIAAGCNRHTEGETLHLIPDRRLAIRHACSLASEGDTVLLLGKGHEATIIGATETIAWDEAEVAREELARVVR